MEQMEQQMSALKRIEIDLFCAFIDVCKKLNLKYYIVGGTLIGAIRHQGFIPWDDDIDVAMPRADYEIFMEKAQEFLPEHYFVQNIYTDKEYVTFFAKIRNSNTTFIETAINHLRINHGIYIDIFPLDFFPESKTAQKRVLWKNKLYTQRISACFNLPYVKTMKHRLIAALLALRYPSIRAVVEKKDKMLKSIPKSNMFASYGGAWGIKEIAPVEWFGEGVAVTFEGMEVIAPTGYHNWLTQVYGDYMQLPPEEKRVAHHYADIIDPNTSYKHYVRF